MKITKFGHSCLLVEEEGVRILLDPGSYVTLPDNIDNLDAIIVTHEHADHYEPENLKKLLGAHKDAQVITNAGVGKRMDKAGIAYQVIGDGQGIKIGAVEIEGHGDTHARIYPTLTPCHNTGYIIAHKLFHPGDSFDIVPSESIELLALPVAGPWCTLGDAIDYAKSITPKHVFPIHDGNLRFPGPTLSTSGDVLKETAIDYQILELGKEYEF